MTLNLLAKANFALFIEKISIYMITELGSVNRVNIIVAKMFIFIILKASFLIFLKLMTW